MKNWKTSLSGLLAFLSFLASQKSEILQILPDRFHAQAQIACGMFAMIGLFCARDAGRGQDATQPTLPQTPAHPAATTPAIDASGAKVFIQPITHE